MAQSTDNDQFQEDPSQNEEGKTSMFSKLMGKTKEHGKKLKAKVQGGNSSPEPEATNDDEEGTEAEDAPVHNAVPAGESQPLGTDVGSFDQKPADTEAPTKDGEGEEGLTEKFEGLSTDEQSAPEQMDSTPAPEDTSEADSGKPVTEKASDGLTSATNQAKEKVLGADAPPVTDQVGQQAQQLGGKASETGKTWSQWAANKVGYAKDTLDAKAPKTAEGKPYHQHAYDTVVGAKNQFAAHTDPNQMPSDPAQHTYVQKAAVGVYGAKDSLYSRTQPADHDKELSQKVTDTVGSLPGQIKSSLGFGAKTASGSSTAEEADGAPPQSPSLVGRITGLFGAKKPATDSAPSSEAATPETAAEPAQQTPEA